MLFKLYKKYEEIINYLIVIINLMGLLDAVNFLVYF